MLSFAMRVGIFVSFSETLGASRSLSELLGASEILGATHLRSGVPFGIPLSKFKSWTDGRAVAVVPRLVDRHARIILVQFYL